MREFWGLEFLLASTCEIGNTGILRTLFSQDLKFEPVMKLYYHYCAMSKLLPNRINTILPLRIRTQD